MNLDLLVIISNLAGLFLLLAVGFVAVKLKILPSSAAAPFSTLLLKISLPCIVFASIQQPFSKEFLLDSLIIIAVNGLLFSLNLALSLLLSRALRIPQDSRGVWCILVAFCNNGFMGFPIIFALFGSEGLALAAMINVPVCLVMYTSTPTLIGRDHSGEAVQKPSLRSILLTPINVSILLGLLVFLLQIPIPETIMNPIRLLGNITTPLSMFVTGMALSAVDLRSIFNDSRVWKATLVRLLIFPAMALLILRLLPIPNPLIVGVTLVTLAMPAAAVTTSLAETYGGDRSLAVKTIFVTSVLCLVTIPLFAMLL